MKLLLRSTFERLSPRLFNAVRALRNRRYFRRTFRALEDSVSRRLFSDGAEIVVQAGPFRGMGYLNETVWGSITPKWLGSYEAELHPVLAEIIERAYPTIIDVGCAEGYYAIGLAIALPETKIHAFDTDFISRGQLRRLAELNGVRARIALGEFCEQAHLEELAKGKCLVVCDIEGFETQLLDPNAAPALRRADLLVEVHESPADSQTTEELLRARFARSHRIERISATGREAWIEKHLRQVRDILPPELLAQAVQEHRTTGRVWLWMRAMAPRT